MQIRRDASLLERTGLIGAATGDQGKRGLDQPDCIELLLPQLEWHESQDADSPRPISEVLLGLREQGAYLRTPKEREREKRQPPACSDSGGKGCRITHAGHRSLDDRIASPV